MYLLKKLFDLREKAHPGNEKTLLEHLEDLRRLMTRIVVTLLISMVICFGFNAMLMDLLRLPVDRLWETQQQARLPGSGDAARPLKLDDWERAKDIDHAVSGLDDPQRDVFGAAVGDPDLLFHARAVSLLRVAATLDGADRAEFLASIGGEGNELRRQVTALLASGADTERGSRGNLRLMSALRPTETFVLSMKLSFFAGIVLAFPLLLMYILQFILPGLDHLRRKILWPAMTIGFGLFLTGSSFAYFAVLPRALQFFHEWSAKLNVSNDWRIGEYITFATNFTLMFGLAFELPVVVMVLVKLGILSYAMMAQTRVYAICAIFITAAIITPPDLFTLIVLGVPMILLYEMCIWITWFQDRKKLRALAAAERAV